MKWLLLPIAAVVPLLVPMTTSIDVDRSTLPADGRATARVHVVDESLIGLRWPSSAELRADGASPLRASDGSWVVRAGPGPGTIALRANDARREITLVLDPSDLDQDGLPDAAELLGDEDRAAFSAWFTAIAEAQATRIDDAWPKIHHDCAGLVRFAVREALKVHDATWLSKRRALASISAPDVAAFHYPDVPFIGENLFRARSGSFSLSDKDAFTAAPSARTLMLNSALISREVGDARPGDLLFFATTDGLHTMIALGARAGATPSDRVTRVVYHTGQTPGEVRVVGLDDLGRHPDPAWHPVPDNARFLGVHRLNLVHHEAREFL